MKNSESKVKQTNAHTANHVGNVILHISDLHFLENPPADRINIETELFSTLENLEPEWKPGIICITGDISDTNNVEGYSKAEIWVKTLLEKLKISPENLVMCPGNHDLNPEKAKLIICPKNAAELETELIAPIPTKYEELFSLYKKLCGNIGVTPLDYNGNSSYLFGAKECGGIFFIVSNSCWFCNPDNNMGMIDLPLLKHLESKYNFLQKKHTNSAKIIALIHHPAKGLSWMDTERYNNAPALGFLAESVNGGVKVSHLAEQKCTTHSLYSRDRPGCQYSILTSSFLLPG